MPETGGAVYPAFALAGDFTVLLTAGAAAAQWPRLMTPALLLGVAALTTAWTGMVAPRGVGGSVVLSFLFTSAFARAPYGVLQPSSAHPLRCGVVLAVVAVAGTVAGRVRRRTPWREPDPLAASARWLPEPRGQQDDPAREQRHRQPPRSRR